MDAPIEPVRIASKPAGDVERIPLFYIDDVEYTIPKTVSANVSLQMLDVMLARGELAGWKWLFNEAVGPKGLAALEAAEGMTDDQLKQLFAAVQGLYAEQVKGLRKN